MPSSVPTRSHTPGTSRVPFYLVEKKGSPLTLRVAGDLLIHLAATLGLAPVPGRVGLGIRRPFLWSGDPATPALTPSRLSRAAGLGKVVTPGTSARPSGVDSGPGSATDPAFGNAYSLFAAACRPQPPKSAFPASEPPLWTTCCPPHAQRTPGELTWWLRPSGPARPRALIGAHHPRRPRLQQRHWVLLAALPRPQAPTG